MDTHNISAGFRRELNEATELHDLGKIYLLAQEARGQAWEAQALHEILARLAAEMRRLKNERKHSLIFSGHMIDSAERRHPRFPASKEGAARRDMQQQLESLNDRPLQGFAGGASGGDILFHELCLELGIPSVVFLALPPEQFIHESVLPAGQHWVHRFNELCQKVPVKVLAGSKEVPQWLNGESYSIWQRTNEWMMQSAFALSGDQCSLMALWDEKAGDGPGGTKQMVEDIQKLRQRVVIINPERLAGG